MKVTTSLLAVCLLIFTVITSSSCKKIIDEIKKNPGNGVASDCRINKVICEIGVNRYDTAYFSYNKAGNPTSIRHTANDWHLGSESTFGASLDMVFKYDNKNRLIATLHNYYRDTVKKTDHAEIWYVYSYESNNTVKVKLYDYASASYANGDAYSTIKNVPESDGGSDIPEETIQLDEFGRIKQYGPVSYNYDANGNLMGNGFVYGSNISYYQTNKIWMFISRNYSINMKTAPLEWYELDDFPTAFNTKKLPVAFGAYPALTGIRIITGLGPATMEYACK